MGVTPVCRGKESVPHIVRLHRVTNLSRLEVKDEVESAKEYYRCVCVRTYGEQLAAPMPFLADGRVQLSPDKDASRCIS